MRSVKSMLLLGMMLSVTVLLQAQDRKEIRDLGITSITIQEYFIEEGLADPLIESIKKYNADGEVIEIKEINRRGEVTRWEKYAYDGDRNLTEEVFLDPKGKVIRTEKSIFKEGLRVEKQFFNERDKLYKKKVYVYEYSQ
ncbi:MAG: RHS repeat domain-containing protein [Bacteroidales bacterium]